MVTLLSIVGGMVVALMIGLVWSSKGIHLRTIHHRPVHRHHL